MRMIHHRDTKCTERGMKNRWRKKINKAHTP